jgi:hypothetical protein
MNGTIIDALNVGTTLGSHGLALLSLGEQARMCKSARHLD